MGGRSGGEKTQDPTAELGDATAQNLGRRVLLIVHHARGTESVPLNADRALTLGRHATSAVSIPDPTLSKIHAKFELRGADVWLEDLGSRNGTTVDGAALTSPRRVGPGDEIRLGAVAVEIHVRESGPALGLEPYERFRQESAEELLAARRLGEPRALLLLRASEPLPIQEWYPRVRKLLVPPFRAAAYGPHEVLLLSRNNGLEAAMTLSPGPPRLVGALALFPEDAAGVDELIERAREALPRTSSETPVVRARRGVTMDAAPEVVASGSMAPVMALAAKVARTKLPVLLIGETGVGKEVLAQRIHAWSGQAEGPLRSINCGSIPPQLIESVLFGHEKGAFTGADKLRRGLFEEADGGTVFLDELGELSAEAQVALLRVLEERRFSRVGSSQDIDVDVRVIAATHRDLEEMVSTGSFRRDLLYRLNAVTITIPPLSQRPEEIEPLVWSFLARARAVHGAQAEHISKEALAALRDYSWPGNIRELRNVIDRAAVIADSPEIGLADLPDAVRARSQPASEEADADGPTLRLKVQGYEKKVLTEALEAAGWNMAQAAKALGIPYRTFTGKLRQLGIQRPKD